MSDCALFFALRRRISRADLRSGLHVIERWTVVAGWVVLSLGFCSFIGLSACAAVLWVLGVLAL
jgi:hypothetical protein